MTDTSSLGPVYLDANPIAYAFEGPEDLASALKDLFALFRNRPGLAVTSELTLAEVLPKRKTPDRQFLDLLIWSGIFDLRPVTREILTETAPYRRVAAARRPNGTLAFPKLPDAIHVVTAIRSGCSIFVSSDGRLKLPDTVRLVSANSAGITQLIRELR
jgi:predicted nucleic acid-binding protein